MEASGIHRAVARNDEEEIKRYVEGGGDLDVRDQNDLSPLHIASAGGFSSVVEFLIKHSARLDVTSRIGHTPLHLACRFGHLSVVILLIAEGAELNARDGDGNTPLHKAASNGKAQLCREMVRRGADIDALNTTKYTPLHWACFKGHKSAAEQLLKCGANIDATSSRRASPLFMATYYGHIDVTFLLLAWGADSSVSNEGGMKAGDSFFLEVSETQRAQITILLKERKALLMKGYEAARRNMALMYMRSERSDLNLRMTQGEVEALWGKLAIRENELNLSKVGARDLSSAVKLMKTALEESRKSSKTMHEQLAALEAELNEARDEARDQRERATRAEQSYASLLRSRRAPAGRVSGAEDGGEVEAQEEGASASFERQLRAEEEGEGGSGTQEEEMVFARRAGEASQAFSKEGGPEWKLHVNRQGGVTSAGSSTCATPSRLNNVPCAAQKMGSRGTLLACGISGQGEPPALPIDIMPGRIAALASRINTRTSAMSPMARADIGPLATALRSPPLSASSPQSYGGSRRSARQRSASPASLLSTPSNGAGGAGTGWSRKATAPGSGSGRTSSRPSCSSATAAVQAGGEGEQEQEQEQKQKVIVPRPGSKPGVAIAARKEGAEEEGEGRKKAAATSSSSPSAADDKPKKGHRSSSNLLGSTLSSMASDDSGFSFSCGSGAGTAGQTDGMGASLHLMQFKKHSQQSQRQHHEKPQQLAAGEGEGEDGGCSSILSEETMPASPDTGGGVADSAAAAAGEGS